MPFGANDDLPSLLTEPGLLSAPLDNATDLLTPTEPEFAANERSRRSPGYLPSNPWGSASTTLPAMRCGRLPGFNVTQLTAPTCSQRDVCPTRRSGAVNLQELDRLMADNCPCSAVLRATTSRCQASRASCTAASRAAISR